MKSRKKNIKLKKNKLFVVCEKKIFAFSLNNFKLIDSIETLENQKGIIAVNGNPKNDIIAYPDKSKGYVVIKDYDTSDSTTICAHEAGLAFITFNHQGSLLATSSERGRYIRIFNTKTGEKIQEVKRGSDTAEINYISFNNSSSFIAVSSEPGNIDIFAIKLSKDEETKNTKDYWGKLLPLEYFQSELSFSKFRITDSKAICTFTEENKLVIISSEGNYYVAEFDQKEPGVDCVKIDEEPLSLFEEADI